MNKINMDVVVIGGSAAGLVAAQTVKNTYPNKSVMVIRKEKKVMIPCGIPYIFGTLDSSNENVMPDQGLINAGIEIKVDTVKSVDAKKHTLLTENNDEITYEKLIMATGSKPFVPNFISGTELKNVFTVPKDKDYLDMFHSAIKDLKRIAVIGAGFIGVELSDELRKYDKEVTLVEAKEHILCQAFDKDTSIIAEELLTSRGIKILNDTKVLSIQGRDKVTGIVLDNGTVLEVDAVVLSIGYVSNSRLALDSGISVNNMGSIKVDAYMRTHQKDVFACGDCAQKRDFITGKLTNIMLASTACAEARVAGMNLYELSTIKTFNGTIGIYSTSIGSTSFGVAGITEKRAKEEGFAILTGMFKGMDRHPGKLNDPHSQSVKLVATKNTGLIVGGEVVGGNSIGELTNVLGFIIQNKMTVSDLLCSQIGTQPMLTASPAKYPLIKAAEMIAKKQLNR